jgi:hypothetical protein
MVPFAFSVIPGGTLPAASDQLYGATPPVAARVRVAVTPPVTVLNVLVLTVSGGMTTVRVNGLVTVTAGTWLSVNCTVKLKVPPAVGMPVIAPVLALIVIPGGSPPAAMDQAYGLIPPVAASALLVDVPTVALVKLLVVMLSGVTVTVRLKALVATAGVAWLSVTRAVKL